MNPSRTPADTRITRRQWIGGSAALLLGGCATPSAAPAPLLAPAADPRGLPAFPWLMRLANVPGMAFAEVGGGRAETSAYGVRRAGTAGGVTEDTVFEAASLSKPVFAYLVLELEREGVIDLGRPAGEYLALPNPDDARARAITGRHLLSHSGGWRNWRFAREHLLTADFEPGSRFSYSGEGFAFLQRVVEGLTGRGLPALARERVFGPLGMASSSFVWHPALEARLASPHTGRGDPLESHGVRTARAFRALEAEWGRPLEEWMAADVERAFARVSPDQPPFPNFTVPNAAASLSTTARDYGAFVRHLLTDGAPVLRRMMEPQVRLNEALQWGLGIGLEEMDGRTLFWHWGDNPGFKNFVVGDPAAGRATVVFTNGNSGRNVYERVIRDRTGTDHPAFLWI
ncbi:MAG TPA: serine hydrolase domain-containing protein [Longimicrobium sp.]|nr:serine hydrolase domain-containing protein [Longimicrobium sp.]